MNRRKVIFLKKTYLPPTAYSGLTGWWDASDATRLYTDAGSTLVSSDGDAVYRFADKSGNNNHFNQSVASLRPLYKVGLQNGRSGLRFDGTNDNMESTAAFITNNAFTIFIVAKLTTLDTNAAHVYSDDSLLFGTGGNWGFMFKNVTPSFHLYNWGAAEDYTTNSTTLGTHIFRGRHDSGNIISSVDDGTENTVASGNCVGIGVIGYLVYQHPAVNIYEVVSYNVVLSAGSRNNIYQFLKKKWGL